MSRSLKVVTHIVHPVGISGEVERALVIMMVSVSWPVGADGDGYLRL